MTLGKGITPNVASVGPLNGGSLDGSARRKARRSANRAERPSIDFAWICPACQRTTTDPSDQARHVAVELTRVYSLLGELGEFREELQTAVNESSTTIIMAARRQLSDDDCRRARMAWMRYYRQQRTDIPQPIIDGNREYKRRKEGARLRYRERAY